MNTNNSLKKAALQLLRSKNCCVRKITKLNLDDLKDYFITDSTLVTESICKDVEASLRESDSGITKVEYKDKSTFKVYLSQPIVPEKIIDPRNVFYLVKNPDVIRKESKIGSIEFNIDSNKNFTCRIFNVDGKVAHHANVQKDSGSLCLGEIAGVNNFEKIGFEILKTLLSTHNYTSPHNSNFEWVFTKGREDLINDKDIESYEGGITIA